jgi:hypothetical protein
MEAIYSNSIEFGRFYTYLMFIIALIVAVIMLWWAWAIKSQNAKFKGVAKASVTDAACEALNKDTLSCAVDAVYTVDGKDLSVSNFAVKTPVALRAGDKVRISYDPANPASAISASDLIPNSWSTSLVYAALLIVIVAAFKLWLAKNYNFAAAGSGVSGVLSAFAKV